MKNMLKAVKEGRAVKCEFCGKITSEKIITVCLLGRDKEFIMCEECFFIMKRKNKNQEIAHNGN